MGERQVVQDRRRAEQFEAFVAGAAGRLLHVAALLSTECVEATRPGAEELPAARELLLDAFSRTYAVWDTSRLEDPYAWARQELVTRFLHSSWRYRRPRGGVLSPLSPRERVIVVLCLSEGVSEEQVAALLGLPETRVRADRERAVRLLGPTADHVHRSERG